MEEEVELILNNEGEDFTVIADLPKIWQLAKHVERLTGSFSRWIIWGKDLEIIFQWGYNRPITDSWSTGTREKLSNESHVIFTCLIVSDRLKLSGIACRNKPYRFVWPNN